MRAYPMLSSRTTASSSARACNINGFIDVKENENTEPYEIPVDATVLSLGIRPDLSMLDEFDARFERVVNIGDCTNPGHIGNTTSSAYLAVKNL